EAEAEALRAQAEAYKQFNDAAVLSKVLEALPTVAGELVAPYANIKDLSIVSTDGESKLANSVSNNLAQVLEVVRGTTGVDLSDLVAKAKGPGGAGSSGSGGAGSSGPGGSDRPDGSGSAGPGGGSVRTGDASAVGSGEIVDGVVSNDSASTADRTRFDPKAFLDDSGIDLDQIGDEVKKATGFDVQSYIDEAKRRLDDRDAARGESRAEGSASTRGERGGDVEDGDDEDGRESVDSQPRASPPGRATPAGAAAPWARHTPTGTESVRGAHAMHAPIVGGPPRRPVSSSYRTRRKLRHALMRGVPRDNPYIHEHMLI